jgi:hypothetical protein
MGNLRITAPLCGTEKSLPASFVSGHDFSRAAHAFLMHSALAAAERLGLKPCRIYASFRHD